jgi:hypothetical protein
MCAGLAGQILINDALLQRGEFAHHGSVAQMFSLSNGDREAHKCFNEVAQKTKPAPKKPSAKASAKKASPFKKAVATKKVARKTMKRATGRKTKKKSR